MKRTTLEQRGRIVAQERHNVFMAMRKAPFEEAERAYLQLEKRLLRLTPLAAWEKRAIKRLIAKDIFSFAYASDVTWPQVARALRRVERWGYSDLWTRAFVANLFVQMVPSFPDKARRALAMLEEAERRVLRVRKGHASRREGLRVIASARRYAAEAGIVPPPPSLKPRRQ